MAQKYKNQSTLKNLPLYSEEILSFYLNYYIFLINLKN